MVRNIRFGILVFTLMLLAVPAYTQDPAPTPQITENLVLISARLYPTDIAPTVREQENEVKPNRSLYVGDSVSVEIKVRIEPDESELRMAPDTDYRITLLSSANLVTRSIDGKTDKEITSKSTTFTVTLNDLPAGDYDQVEVKLCLDAKTRCLIGSDREAAVTTDIDPVPEATSEATLEPAIDSSIASSDYLYSLEALIKPFSIKSNLPPEVNALFATLALFAGTMLTVAVAVEIIVDSMRPLLGLKRDMSAGEALKQVREQLPNQLGELGANANSIREIKSLMSILDKATYRFTTWTEVTGALKTGKLAAIAAIAQNYLENPLSDPDSKGGSIISEIKTRVNDIGEELAKTFSYNQAQIENITGKLASIVDQIDMSTLETSLTAYAAAYQKALDAGDLTPDVQEQKAFEQAAINYAKELANKVQRFAIDLVYEWVERQVAASNITSEDLRVRAGVVAGELKGLNISETQLQQLMGDALNVARGFSLIAVKQILDTVWAKRVAISSTLFAITRYPIYVLLNHKTRQQLLDAYIDAHQLNKVASQIKFVTDRIKPPLNGIQETLTSLQQALSARPPNLPIAKRALEEAHSVLSKAIHDPLEKLYDAQQSVKGANVALNKRDISAANEAFNDAVEALNKIDIIDIADARQAFEDASTALIRLKIGQLEDASTAQISIEGGQLEDASTAPDKLSELTIAKQKVKNASDVINFLTSKLTLTESLPTQGWVTIILFLLLPLLALFACSSGVILQMGFNPLLVPLTVGFSLFLGVALLLATFPVYARFDFKSLPFNYRKPALQATYSIIFGTIVLSVAWWIKVFTDPGSSVATLLIGAIIGLILLLVFKSTEAATEKWAQTLRLLCATLFQGVVSIYLTLLALEIAKVFTQYLKGDENSQPILDPVLVSWGCVYGVIVLFYLGISATVVTRREQSPSQDLTTQTELGKVIVEFENHFRDDEVFRIRTIRILTIITGIILARIAHIDGFTLLRSALPAFAESLNTQPIDVLEELGITPGILLTGLAAAAGSAFWHDVLDRLRAAKQTLEMSARAVRQAKELGDTL